MPVEARRPVAAIKEETGDVVAVRAAVLGLGESRLLGKDDAGAAVVAAFAAGLSGGGGLCIGTNVFAGGLGGGAGWWDGACLLYADVAHGAEGPPLLL